MGKAVRVRIVGLSYESELQGIQYAKYECFFSSFDDLDCLHI